MRAQQERAEPEIDCGAGFARSVTRRGFLAASIGMTAAALLRIELGREAYAALQEEAEENAGVARMSMNENPFGPSPAAVEAMRTVAPQTFRYPGAEATALRIALAERFDVRSSLVQLGCGSTELIDLAGQAYLEPGGEYVEPAPTYGYFGVAAAKRGAKAVRVPVRSDMQIDLDALAGRVGEKTNVVYLCNPNNPTGRVLADDALYEFAKGLPKSATLVLDEAYVHYRQPADDVGFLRYLDKDLNFVALRTFSKAYALAGARIGYAIGTEKAVRRLQSVAIMYSANKLGAAAATAALGDDAHLARSRAEAKSAREYLAGELRKMNLAPVESTTNFLIVDLGRSGPRVAADLARNGVMVRSGDIWGLPDYLRVSCATKEENARFVAALKTVLATKT
jgi:histidinol-phosphate aminotransferase